MEKIDEKVEEKIEESKKNIEKGRDKSRYIKLPNDWYDNKDITNEELTVLILLYRNYMQYKSIGVCGLDFFAKSMYINSNSNKNIIKIIKETIESLIEKGYITKLYDIHYNIINSINNIKENKDGKTKHSIKNDIFYVELAEEPPVNNYFQIQDTDIDNIFKYLQNVNINKFSLIRYFVACKRVSNNNNFGYLTQGKLKQLVNHSSTIQRYNKILKDLQLIKFNSDYLTAEKHYCTTFIGNYNNDMFDKMVQEEAKNRGYIFTDKTKANEKRSSKQKINSINKKIEDDKIIAEKDIEIEKLKAEVEKYRSMQYIDHKKQEEKIIQEDKEIIESINELYGSNQYEDDQMNSNDIMPDIINTIDDEIPESLKLTKQLQDELEEINIDDIWGESESKEIKIKTCVICREKYTGETNRDKWCQKCIDNQKILDRNAMKYKDYDYDYEF